MNEKRKPYNPNQDGCIDVKKMASEFLIALKASYSEVVKHLNGNLETYFSEDDENRFMDLLEMDEWETKDLLELSSLFYAIAVMQGYEEKE